MKCFLTGILLLISGALNAANYYVDPSSTSTTQNGTQASPWKSLATLQSNLSAVNPGDFVYFKRGQTFSGSLLIRRSGTALAPITFSTYGTATEPPVFTGIGEVMIHFSYVQYIVFDGIRVTDPTMDVANHALPSNLKRAFNIDGSSYITVKNCDISLVGTGFNIMGNNNRIENNSIRNLRMIRNTVTSINNNDDYGAMAMVISGSNNDVLGNYMDECWANSYDYTFDGSGVEIFGSNSSNNRIMYNTAFNCNGFMEFGSSSGGISSNNLVAYNKIINCGDILYINNSGAYALSVTNLQIFNNVIVETAIQLSYGSKMIGMRQSSPDTGIVILKNNIFWLMTGIDVAQSNMFTGEQLIHDNNIYKLGPNSVLNYERNPSELITTSNSIFSSSIDPNPLNWNFRPASGSPAINFGQNVGIVKDFEGVNVPAIPHSGIMQTVQSNSSPLQASAVAGSIVCNGGTATVTVTATGGTTPYTGTGTFTVSAGSYSYTVRDANGSSTTASVSLAQPAALTATVSTGAITTTGGTTTVTVAATGGTGTRTFRLNSGSYQSSNTFSSVAVGNHTITVKDGNNCTITRSFSIVQTAPLAASATSGAIACNGGTTTVTVTATGGTAPYTGTGNFTVTAGTHNYTVRDANGLTATRSITVSQPAVLTASLIAGTITAIGGTTTITVTASGGTGTRTFKLNSGSYQSGNVFSNVLAGTHTVTIKDANNCTITNSITITQPIPLQAASTAGTISCNGGTTTVDVTATGGNEPYTGTGTFTMAAGTHTFTVRDATGNTSSTTIRITEPTAVDGTVTTGAINAIGATTSVTVNGAGGTPAYFYSLNFGAYQPSNQYSNLPAGSYTVRVRDTKGCIKSVPFTLAVTPVSPLVVHVTYGAISCNGGTTTATVTASGGIIPYTGTGTFTVGAGTHSFTVTDAINATDMETVTISQPQTVSLSLSAGTISTNGGTTSITATASGGNGGFMYKLGSGSYQTSNVFSGLVAGTYTVTARDSKGCLSSSRSVTITQPPLPFSLSLSSKSDISCKGRTDGRITVSGANGYPSYQYRIGSGSYGSSNVFSNLAPGTYTVTGRDANGFTSSVSVTIASSTVNCNTLRSAGTWDDEPVQNEDIPLVTVFPNPSQSYFKVQSTASATAQTIKMQIFDSKGSMMHQQIFARGSQVLVGERLPSGVYVMKLSVGNQVFNYKLVKTL